MLLRSPGGLSKWYMLGAGAETGRLGFAPV